MLSSLNLSSVKLLKFIREEQRMKSNINKKQIKNYIILNNMNLDEDGNFIYKNEKEILFMIHNFVSIDFISNYFNVKKEYVKEIANKHKSNSYLLSSFTENEDARCFTKNQILRVAEEFNYICPMCFKPLNIMDLSSLTGHHIQPFARGGKTKVDNCLPLHVKCHFEDFKLLHSALFDSENPIYSLKYFNSLKKKLKFEKSGIDFVLNI